jgi:hypothetical protein
MAWSDPADRETMTSVPVAGGVGPAAMACEVNSAPPPMAALASATAPTAVTFCRVRMRIFLPFGATVRALTARCGSGD